MISHAEPLEVKSRRNQPQPFLILFVCLYGCL